MSFYKAVSDSSTWYFSQDGYTMLHAAVMGHQTHSLRKLLIYLRTSLDGPKFQKFVNLADKDGRTALHFAASDGNRECVGVLCACEEVISSQRDRWNRTPMDFANEGSKELLRNRGKSTWAYTQNTTVLISWYAPPGRVDCLWTAFSICQPCRHCLQIDQAISLQYWNKHCRGWPAQSGMIS